MQELIQQASLSRAEHFCAARLNPPDMEGLFLTTQPRLFIFRAPDAASLQIDFAAQAICTDRVYVIPAFHFYKLQLSYPCQLICIDLDEDLLAPESRQLLYGVSFTRDKSIRLPFHNIYDQMLSLLMPEGEARASLPVSATIKWLEYHFGQSISHTARIAPGYLHMACSFLHLLNRSKLSLDDCTVTRFADALGCSEKSLNRVSQTVFHTGTQDILKLQLAMKAIFLLDQNMLTLKQISSQLGFAHTASFYRYLKRYAER